MNRNISSSCERAICELPKVCHNWKLRLRSVGLLRSRITRVDIQSFILGQRRSLSLKVHGFP